MTRRSPVSSMPVTWPECLSRFHGERAGVTEVVLSRCADRHGATPYEWLSGSIGDGEPVLDLACGSAPLWSRLAGRGYLGVDRSAAELSLAGSRGAGPLVSRGRGRRFSVPAGPDHLAAPSSPSC